MEESYLTARRYLQEHNVLCLATCIDQQPWVAPVFYAAYNDRLVFLSAPHTLHCQHIASNPNVSASIQEDYKDWTEIKGFQLQGIASRVGDSDKQAVIDRYAEKFPVTGDKAPASIAKALDKIHWFEISVNKLLFIDNSIALGHRVELDPAQLFAI